MLDRITDFTWTLNPEWQDKISKDQLKKFFLDFKETTLVVQKQGSIIAVFVYMFVEGVYTFILMESVMNDGFQIMREFIRNNKHNKISWLSKSMEYIKCHN